MLRINQFAGFYAQGLLRVKVIHIGGSDLVWSNSSISTPVDFDLGQEDTSRHVILCFTSTDIDAVPNGVDLEGTNGAQEVTERGAVSNLSAEIWSIDKPTGKNNQSLTISLTSIQSSAFARVELFSVYYVGDTNFAFDSGALAGFEGTTISWNLAVPLGGAVFGCATPIANSATLSWTGITEVAETASGKSTAAQELPFVASPRAISVIKSSSTPSMVAAVLAVAP